MAAQRGLGWAGVLVLCLTLGPGLEAQEAQPPAIDRVEEDWELVVENPSVEECGPQLTMTMSPVGDNSRAFFAFNVNYRDSSFRPGGLQVRYFHEERDVQTPHTSKSELLATPGETVRWTERMSLWGGVLAFNIQGGQSTTWGSFGLLDNLWVAYSTDLRNLNGYDSSVSAARSGAGWQSNRVGRLTLKQVRYYAGGELVRTEEESRTLIGGSEP